MQVKQATQVLFLDLETVPLKASFEELDDRGKALWEKKMGYHIDEGKEAAELYQERGGILAEFGKIVCATFGYLQEVSGGYQLKLHSVFGEDERQLLGDISTILEQVGKGNLTHLCAHNGIEFDFPFLARRLVINSMPLPSCLDLSGLKPWEVPHIDTMVLWKFGDRKAYTSLDLLSYVFGIPSPKEDMDGSMVKDVYYGGETDACLRIAKYCEQDVVTLAKVYLRLSGNSKEIQEIKSEII